MTRLCRRCGLEWRVSRYDKRQKYICPKCDAKEAKRDDRTVQGLRKTNGYVSCRVR